MERQKKLRARILSFALSVAMVFTTLPATVFAEGGDTSPQTPSTIVTTERNITAFDELGEGFSKPVLFDGHTYMRNVELNTAFEEVGLPTVLSVTVEKTTTTTITTTAPTTPSAILPGGELGNTPVTETVQETIPVTWAGDSAYTPAENSKVNYTAVLPEGYMLADGVMLPSITVMVGRQARGARAAISEGQTYYFDLSSAVDGCLGYSGAINIALPDTSLRYVPFTYAGAVNAYNLVARDAGNPKASDNAAKNPSNRSLFVADYNISSGANWDELNYDANLIFGKPFDNGNYTLRSLSVGNYD
ncbi:MAG: hypothetical protein RSJ40_01755, partial [Acetivibrio sp.]